MILTPPTPPGIQPIETKNFSHASLTTPAPGTLASQGMSFSDLLTSLGKSTRDALKISENLSHQAASGTADPQAVATAVVEAKAALQQFTSLLNAATMAHQEVMRLAL